MNWDWPGVPHPERITAFQRHYSSIKIWGRKQDHLSVNYNCGGEPIELWGGRGNKSHWWAKYPAAIWALNKYFCTEGTGPSPIRGGWEDVRGLWLRKRHCCPEIINSILLGEEGMPD